MTGGTFFGILEDKLQNYYQVTEVSISYVIKVIHGLVTFLAVPASVQQKRTIKFMKSSYGRTKKLRQETKSYRDCFSLAC